MEIYSLMLSITESYSLTLHAFSTKKCYIVIYIVIYTIIVAQRRI